MPVERLQAIVSAKINDFKKKMAEVRKISTGIPTINTVRFEGDMDDLQSELKRTQNNYNATLKDLNRLKKATANMNQEAAGLRNMATASDDVADSYREMKREMQGYYSDSYAAKMAERKANREIMRDYAQLAANQDKYGGNTKKLITVITNYGQKHKEMMKNAVNNSNKARAAFFKQIGTAQAATTMASQASDQIKRNYGPVRALDRGFLKLGDSLERTAKKGHAATVALKELGPTASMYELQKLMKHINKMAGGITMLQFGALIVTGVEIALLVKLSNTLDGRLIPAFERFKQVWLDALHPFAHAVTEVFLAVIKFGTAIGEFFKGIAETNPLLSQMIWGFLALIPPLTLILAPLALGLALWRNYQVMFAKLYTMIRPVLTAFLGVIGTVIAVAAAIVVGVVAWQKMVEHSEKLRNAIANLKQAFSDMWNSFIQAMLPAWNTLKAAFTDLLQTLTGADTLTNFWQIAGDNLAAVFNWIASAVVPILSQGMQVLATVFSTVFTAIANVLNGFSSWWTANVPAIQAFAQGLWQVLTQVFTGIKEAAMTMINALKPMFVNLAAAFLDMVAMFKGTGAEIGISFQGILDTVLNVVQQVANFALPLLQQAFQGATVVISAVVLVLIKAFNSVSQWWSTNGDMVIEKVRYMGEMVVQAFTSIWTFIQQIMPQIVSVIQSAWELIKTVFTTVMPIIQAVVKTGFAIISTIIKVVWPIIVSIIQSAWNNIKLAITSAIAIIQNVIQLFTNLLQGNWRAAWENVKNIVKNAVIFLWNAIQLWFLGKFIGAIRSFGTQALSLIRTSWASIVSAFRTALTTIGNWVKTKFTAVKTSITNAMRAAWNYIKTAWSGIVNKIRSSLATIKAKVQSIFQSIKSFIISVWSSIKSRIGQFVDDIYNGIRSKFTQMKTTIQNKLNEAKQKVVEIWNKIKTFLESIDLKQIGKDIIQGLINGIISMATEAVEAVKGVVKKVIKGAKSMLDSNSPSKVFIGIGKDTTEGLAIGISKQAKSAVKATEGMVSQVNRAGEGVALGLASSMPSVDIGVNSSSFDKIKPTIESDYERNEGDIYLQADGRTIAKVLKPHNDKIDRTTASFNVALDKLSAQ